MQWFEDKKNNVSYNDEALDEVFHFIERFSTVYKKDAGRLPTITELEYLLSISLQANAEALKYNKQIFLMPNDIRKIIEAEIENKLRV